MRHGRESAAAHWRNLHGGVCDHAVAIYEGDNASHVAQSWARKWGLTQLEQGMITEETKLRGMARRRDMETIGGGMVSIDTHDCIPYLILSAGVASSPLVSILRSSLCFPCLHAPSMSGRPEKIVFPSCSLNTPVMRTGNQAGRSQPLVTSL